MKTITKLALFPFLALATSYGAISPTTGLDQAKPWLEVLQALDQGRITLTLTNPIITGSVVSAYATTATAAGSTTLTALSPGVQFFTGTTTQTVVLPVASTMAVGQAFTIENNSTGLVTVNSSGANAVLVLGASTRARITCVVNSGTDQTSWDAFYEATNEASGKVVTFNHTSTFTTTDAQTYTFPTTSATLARIDAANTFTGASTATSWNVVSPIITTGLTASGSASNDFSASTGTFKPSAGGTIFPAGTTSVAPETLTSGTNLTSAVAGSTEYDGVSQFFTGDTTSGRGFIPVQQVFRLTSNGSTISTIGNFFGANSNVSLVASGFYEIDIYAWFLNTTSGTVVWTLTNTAAPTNQNILYEMSPATGIVAPPGTATMLVGQIVNDTTATKALTATAALTDGANHYAHLKIWLQNGTGTSLKIQATKSAGTITPLVGSFYTVTRRPANNTGAFAP